MDKRIPLAVLLIICCRLNGSTQIVIVHPPEEAHLAVAPRDSTFIIGHVRSPVDSLKINGVKIPLYENGAFMAFLPVRFGDFFFVCRAFLNGDSTTVRRRVHIPPLHDAGTDTLVVLDVDMEPSRDISLCAGDILNVSFYGTPECTAGFSIDGIYTSIPMVESRAGFSDHTGENVFGNGISGETTDKGGFYTGSCLLPAGIYGDGYGIRFRLVNSAGDTVLKSAPGRLSLWDGTVPRVVRTKEEYTVLRTGPERSYYYFLPPGIGLWVTGRFGDELRIRLSDTEEAWVHQDLVEWSQRGTPVPTASVRLVRTQSLNRKTRVRVFTGRRVPFRIEQQSSPETLRIRFYGITADTDWIRFDPADHLIRNIRWRQLSHLVYELDLMLNQKQQWGYKAYYDERDHFVIDIKKTPEIKGWPGSPLKGISVLIDPGHEPDTGAIGPTGITEKEINMELAQVLGEKLGKKGAEVYFTRSDMHGLSLKARIKLSGIIDADIFLSLHHNALPDGVNPETHRGSSTYYYLPQSRKLAELIQEELVKNLKLPDFGLFWDNLAVCRIPFMPAVLCEPAFIIHPVEESFIASEGYRQTCAKAIVRALERFLKQSRE
jgi:N-acetylmuramoyl-L-alanine amidase